MTDYIFHMFRSLPAGLILFACPMLLAGELEELIQAGEQGDAGAQFLLGSRYDHGHGIPEDDAEAARWYLSAAQQGHASAQYYLGHKYARGDGVDKDTDNAVHWLREAAGQGHAAGRGLPKDEVQAYAWFSVSAALGFNAATEAMETLSQGMTNAGLTEAEELSREYLKTYGPAQENR